MDINQAGTTDLMQEAEVDLSLNCSALSKIQNLSQGGIKFGGQH